MCFFAADIMEQRSLAGKVLKTVNSFVKSSEIEEKGQNSASLYYVSGSDSVSGNRIAAWEAIAAK